MSIEPYKDLRTSDWRLALAKFWKIVTDGFPSFRPILFAISTPRYKLEKLLVSMPDPQTNNEYTIKDFFTFAEEVVILNCDGKL